MDWRERIQDPDTTPEEFFTEILPALHQERGAEEFGDFSEVPLVVSFVLEGEGGGHWTVTFQEGDLEVEEGEGWDDPLLTLVSQMQDWPLTLARLAGWLERFEEMIDQNSDLYLREKDLKPLQRIDGTIELIATDFQGPDDEEPRDLRSVIYLNSYEQRTEDGFKIIVSALDYQKMVDRELTPAKAFAEGQIKLEGNVSLAMQLASTSMRLRRR